jgi:prepilin-type N-terminal cleavage/methylation domain-containing protein
MFKNRSGRSGFTLPEVLVTVAIVAVLAAVVVPAVTQQLGKGDAPAFNSSVNSLRTAITSFVSDTRAFPGKVRHLTTAITTSDTTLFGTPYTNRNVNGWRGPYESSGTSTGLLPVGYGWTTRDTLTTGTNYLILHLSQTGADTTDAHELDVAIDGGDGGGAGLVRYDPTTSTTVALTPANQIQVYLMSAAN